MSFKVATASLVLLLAACVCSDALGQAAQDPVGQSPAGHDDWNSPRARHLVERAIVRRASWTGGDELRDYQARAEGHIYFLYDLGSGTSRHLVKADQLALRLYWGAGGRTRQVIIGRRERKALPTGIHYHLDHLTVVMDNFDDRITLGEGAEIRDVLHPAAPGALGVYEYRLADSLTLTIPQREVQVYKIEMRPTDPSRAGLVGGMYVDRATADIVQMEFTFTAAAYRDRSLEYFNVRLENALWGGRYWLPFRQGIELRREFEVLDFPAGGIIRAEFSIGDYRFNTGLDPVFFRGPRIRALPERVRERYEFDDDLLDALDPDVAASPPSMDAFRREAARMVRRSYLNRIEGLRPAIPGASSILRFRRAEGLYAGPAVARRLPGGVSLLALGGYAFGADRWQLSGRLRSPLSGSLDLEASGYVNRTGDATPWAASSGMLSTLAVLVEGEDYREPYWSSGGTVSIATALGPARGGIELGWEEWESARLEADELVDRSYRAVRSLDEGEVAFLALELKHRQRAAMEAVGGASWGARIEGSSKSIAGDFDYVRGTARLKLSWPRLWLDTDLTLGGGLAAAGGAGMPAQRLIPAGGRGTVRGYSFHRFAGNLYGGGGVELTRRVIDPLLSAGLFAEIGWVGLEGESARRALREWNRVGDRASPARGPLVGVGGGVGFLFDILHVEVARGVRQGGLWELIIRVRREFWDWL